MIVKTNMLILFLLTLSFTVQAQDIIDSEHEESRLGRPLSLNTSTFQTGIAAYLGFSAGYTSDNLNSSDREIPASIKVLGSYVFSETPIVIDLGYGVQRSSFSHINPSIEETSKGVFETAARLQFGKRWQGGAVFNQFADQGENFEASQADVQFLGVQVLNEFGIGQTFLGRFGARVMTSLNVEGKNVTMALAEFQLGWGRTNKK